MTIHSAAEGADAGGGEGKEGSLAKAAVTCEAASSSHGEAERWNRRRMKISTRRPTTATWTRHRHIGEVPAMAAGGDGGMVEAGGVMAEDLMVMNRGERATQQ